MLDVIPHCPECDLLACKREHLPVEGNKVRCTHCECLFTYHIAYGAVILQNGVLYELDEFWYSHGDTWRYKYCTGWN